MATEIVVRIRHEQDNALGLSEQALEYDIEDFFEEMYGADVTVVVIEIDEEV